MKLVPLRKALKETIFQIAVLHLLLLIFQALRTGDFMYLSIANILDFHLFIEGFEYTATTAIFSGLPVLILFVTNYVRSRK